MQRHARWNSANPSVLDSAFNHLFSSGEPESIFVPNGKVNALDETSRRTRNPRHKLHDRGDYEIVSTNLRVASGNRRVDHPASAPTRPQSTSADPAVPLVMESVAPQCGMDGPVQRHIVLSGCAQSSQRCALAIMAQLSEFTVQPSAADSREGRSRSGRDGNKF